MEKINEIDFEIIKEFINLPLDSVKHYLETLFEHECAISIASADVVEAVNSGVQDGAIGIDVECSGSINGHVIYFFDYSECEKPMMLKNRDGYNNVSDDDKYEYVMDGVREFVSDISTNLANIYHMLIACDVVTSNVEAFTVPRASEFYDTTFEKNEQVVAVNVGITCGEQRIDFKKIISSELSKSIVDMFYNSDIKLPSQMQTLGESVTDGPVASTSDAFSVGNADMSGFINDELALAMDDDNDSAFSEDIAPILNPKETPISEKVEHIAAPKNSGNLDLILSVPVEVAVEVGRTKKRIKEILDFKKGTLVELDRVAGEPMDIFVNGKCIAKGEVVVMEDKFGVRITKIMKTNDIFD